MSVLSAWVSEIFNYRSGEVNTKQFSVRRLGRDIHLYVISVQGWNSCVFFQIHFRLLNPWLRVLWVRTLLYWFSNQLLHYFIVGTVITKDFSKSEILSFYLGNTVKSFHTSVWPFSPHDNTPPVHFSPLQSLTSSGISPAPCDAMSLVALSSQVFAVLFSCSYSKSNISQSLVFRLSVVVFATSEIFCWCWTKGRIFQREGGACIALMLGNLARHPTEYWGQKIQASVCRASGDYWPVAVWSEWARCLQVCPCLIPGFL